jgi:hypothetical protein
VGSAGLSAPVKGNSPSRSNLAAGVRGSAMPAPEEFPEDVGCKGEESISTLSVASWLSSGDGSLGWALSLLACSVVGGSQGLRSLCSDHSLPRMDSIIVACLGTMIRSGAYGAGACPTQQKMRGGLSTVKIARRHDLGRLSDRIGVAVARCMTPS